MLPPLLRRGADPGAVDHAQKGSRNPGEKTETDRSLAHPWRATLTASLPSSLPLAGLRDNRSRAADVMATMHDPPARRLPAECIMLRAERVARCPRNYRLHLPGDVQLSLPGHVRSLRRFRFACRPVRRDDRPRAAWPSIRPRPRSSRARQGQGGVHRTLTPSRCKKTESRAKRLPARRKGVCRRTLRCPRKCVKPPG